MNSIKVNVEKGTIEWSHIQYRLQLFLGLPAATPVSISRFQSASQQLKEMQTQYHGKPIADACIQTTELDDQQFKKIFSKKADMRGLIFQTGHLVVDTQGEPMGKRYSLLLMRIAIGDSFCISETDYDLLQNIPEGYDSAYLISQQDQPSLYKHNYILKSRNQYVIQYQITFTLSKQKQYNPREVICSKCQKRVAVAFCKQEEAYFCSQCNIMHHKDKLMINHVRDPLSKTNSLGKCPLHSRILTIYCADCSRFLCIECTLSGDHSVPDKSSHSPVLIDKYYKDKELQNPRYSAKKKEQLTSDLNKLEGFIKQIGDHTQQLYTTLKNKFQRAIAQLNRLSKVKIDELLTMRVQIKRQLDQCIWTESFIKYQQQVLKPQYYAESQKQFDIYIKQLAEARPKPVRFYDTDTIAVEGDVFVIQKNKKRSRSGSESKKNYANPTVVDLYERNKEFDESRTKQPLPFPQVVSRMTQLYSQSEHNLPKVQTPSAKQSRFTNLQKNRQISQKQSGVNTRRAQQRTTNRALNYDIEESVEMQQSKKQSRRSPAKQSPSSILKRQFGKLGFNTFSSN